MLTDVELAEIRARWDNRIPYYSLEKRDANRLLEHVDVLTAELRRLRGMRCETPTWHQFEERVGAAILEVIRDLGEEVPELLAGIIADEVASLADDIWGLRPDGCGSGGAAK
jgi:hypothetical protein